MLVHDEAKASDAPILIIEDSDEDFEACVVALQDGDAPETRVIRCETGDDAMAFLGKLSEEPKQSDSPCMILLDLNLPGYSGFDILDRVKNDPRLKPIPVVIMTSSRNRADVDACYRNGANSYVHKPVDLDGFFSTIKRLRDFWFRIALLPDAK